MQSASEGNPNASSKAKQQILLSIELPESIDGEPDGFPRVASGGIDKTPNQAPQLPRYGDPMGLAGLRVVGSLGRFLGRFRAFCEYTCIVMADDLW
jgi:hypothetical protein